jgi:hypothetical protein
VPDKYNKMKQRGAYVGILACFLLIGYLLFKKSNQEVQFLNQPVHQGSVEFASRQSYAVRKADTNPTASNKSINSDTVRKQREIVNSLIQREREAAELIEVAPYPKMLTHIVAIPAIHADLRSRTIAQQNALVDGESELNSQIAGFLEFIPTLPNAVASGSTREPTAWRIIWFNLYGDNLDKYRFQIIDTDLEPEEVFTYLPGGLLAAQQTGSTRISDITLENAKARYGHLFSIEESTDAKTLMQPLLTNVKGRVTE